MTSQEAFEKWAREQMFGPCEYAARSAWQASEDHIRLATQEECCRRMCEMCAGNCLRTKVGPKGQKLRKWHHRTVSGYKPCAAAPIREGMAE